MVHLYHIAKKSDWEQAKQDGEYRIGSLARDFTEDGFIHLSYAHQVNVVADLIYKDVHDLLLLRIDPSKLHHGVMDEQADAIDGQFPHLYGPLNIDAVDHVAEYNIQSNGYFPIVSN